MDKAAYYVALFMVMVIPAVVPFWLLVHPLVGFWRRLGAARTYMILTLVMLLVMGGMFGLREPLLRIRFGVQLPLVGLSVVLMIIAFVLSAFRHVNLGSAVLAGVPEIPPQSRPGKLITRGVYAHIRNPRYVEGFFVIAAAALFSNYLAVYVLWAAYLPVIYLVVLLEERELKDRFGGDYEQYLKEVPRFIPRFRKGKNS
jgi:protein-S-isoprenylcysteine O-methyltransferase Ste14